MERLGLCYDFLKMLNPSLIYCAISGFGRDGPWANRPAYDQIVHGLAGVMSVTGDAGSAPLRTGFPISHTLGGLTASFAIAAALSGRPPTGEGTPLADPLRDGPPAARARLSPNHPNPG